MTKDEIAATFEEIAVLLELKGENVFRCNAYRNAARAVQQLDGDIKALSTKGELESIRGIGKAIAEKIGVMVSSGSLPYLDELKAEIPAGLLTLLKIPGLGPKKAKALFDTLQIDSLDKLKAACEKGQVAALKGFGEKSQAKIMEGLAFADTVGNRVRFDQAFPLATALLEQIKGMPGVIRAELCGSIRRRRETTKDIDILASAKDAKPIMDAFVKLPEVIQVVGHGETKSSITAAWTHEGSKIVLNADLRVVPDESFPFALHYFTGSKQHNIRMRQRAIDRGLSLNEYALSGGKKQIACKEEKDVFDSLEIHFVPPELREDTGEFEAAKLPKLIELKDLKGVFHNHTTYSDGVASLEEMALATKALGLEYYGAGDHSQSLKIANGMSVKRVMEQWEEIERLNKKLRGVKIIKGIESDILEDGSLDYPDDVLAKFDYVVASVHTHFGMTAEEQTERICKALAYPYTTMLGHATGRLLLRRDAYKLDLDAVIECAARHGKMIEINANPLRLDLDWIHVKKAKRLGIPLVINPDAHAPEELKLIQYGIFEARRGWLEAKDVFNTKGYDEVMKVLRSMR